MEVYKILGHILQSGALMIILSELFLSMIKSASSHRHWQIQIKMEGYI